MDIKETSIYLKKIENILNKDGDKINYNGYFINELDKREFDSLLLIEKILYNKKVYIESTNKLRIDAQNRLNEIYESDASLEKNALQNILLVLENTPKANIEDLTLWRKILIPKEDEWLFLDNINKTVISRSKPLRDASKEDIEDLTLDIKLKDEQRIRINEYIKSKNDISKAPEITIDEMIESLDDGMSSLKKTKEQVKNTLNINPYQIQKEEYKSYLQKCYTTAIKQENDLAKEYYEEMLFRLSNTGIIEEVGYLYQN